MESLPYGPMAALSVDGAGLLWRAKRLWRLRARRSVPLAAIVAGHALVFYLIGSGMLHQVAQTVVPKVVTVSFVAAPEPLKAAAPAKTVPLAPQLPTYVPPLPQLAAPQVEPAITVAPPSPKPSEPAAVAASTVVAAPAPMPTLPAAPKTISGVEYVRAPQPVYPGIARRLGESGTVTLRVLIGAQGHAEQVVVQTSSGSANLDEAARQAVLRALYKPYIEDGKAIPVYALVPINFQLG